MYALLHTDPRKIYTVSEVTSDIRVLLENSFPAIWVAGEISNFKQSSAGHWYFKLKDERAQMDAVLFRGINRQFRFVPEDGLEVIIHGRVTIYEPQSCYQMIVDALEPKGLGALQLAFEQLKKKLASEGLFDAQYKKPIPFLSQKVGIITSKAGAALHDMLTVINRRFPGMGIVVHPVLVQGNGAAQEIAEALFYMNQRDDIDVLIVGRGGGSIEDLWSFNEEIVVRAIFNSKIPVISAVGHETDYTLADLVADLRAPTPSAAAELAVPEKEDLLLLIDQHRSGLCYAQKQFLRTLREKIVHLKKFLKNPREILEGWKQRCDDFRDRLLRAEENFLNQKKYHLKALIPSLQALSPLGPLARGFALAFLEGKTKPLRSAKEVKEGDLLNIRLGDGIIKARVF